MTANGLHRYSIVFFLFMLLSCGSPTPPSTDSELNDQRLWGDKFETQRLRIPSFDGTELAALLFQPKDQYFPGERPGLIFVNSWTLTEDEYHLQARKFAQKGYVVLSYATRGFSTSEGLVSVAGPNDLGDVSSMIDWLESNTQLDTTRLGMAGVSYGAGISLMALAHEPRIKTVVAMSGWGDLEQALYGRETIREVWLNLLLLSGKLLGRLDPEVSIQARRLRDNVDADVARAWAAARSPLSYVDKINARKAPVLLANSYQDGLFPPAQMRAFYEKLEGPKQFYLDKGIHASSAIPGLFGLPSEVWNETHRWFDSYLQNLPNTLASQGPISMQTPGGREFYSQFPTLVGKQAITTLKPVNELADLGVDEEILEALQGVSFTGSVDSGATSGLPLLSDTADATINLPVIKQLTNIDRRHAALYMTEKFKTRTRLRGAPQIRIWSAASKTPQQMIAYLYDADPWARGTLITHGVVSKRLASARSNEVLMDLNIAAYDIPAGHRLVVAVDTRDPLYGNYMKERYPVGFIQLGTRLTELA
ncbi:MAG: prolyl oligopeptidase family serine peptidase, partial [Pseudobdellovibrionaceae bacterium]|nr:prolyl oligopeptidase family serine peptidase [Pseudobdellovibrionaceae bacterium]